MNNVSKIRLTPPQAASGEIFRKRLINSVLNNNKKLAYIHAGAGYGKTTLLSQVSCSVQTPVWLSLDGESGVFSFAGALCEAIHLHFPWFSFIISEYLPFEDKENFITLLANSLINALENLKESFMLILDDMHTIKDSQIKKFIEYIIKYKPENIQLCISSREAPWQDLLPYRIRGSILELTEKELSFTQDEVAQILGFVPDSFYNISEGWPLAIGSFKVLMEKGVSPPDIPKQEIDMLYSYLFYECIRHLSPETVSFLKTTACFEELDAKMLNVILHKENTKLILEDLVSQNLFINKTGNSLYRYHALFREYLLEGTEPLQIVSLLNKAASYYFNTKQYSKAADYAISSSNFELLQQIILNSYKDYIKSGNFSKLRDWFHALEQADTVLNREILIAKSAFLSSIGNFSDAKICLDTVIPMLNEKNSKLYLDAMLHKARVLRNYVSFEESNNLLDELLLNTDKLTAEQLYMVAIEKIYNLCWNSQMNEAFKLSYEMIELCANAGYLKVKAWFERYLTAVFFFAGKMKDTIYYYEKFLKLPEDEQLYLDMHNIGIYAAKAYQMLGNQTLAVSIISQELNKLKAMGRYEELWSGYLLAAEIHYHVTCTERINGKNTSYETAIKCFTLADEYAPLYRKTEFQKKCAKMQRLVSSLMFSHDSKESIVSEILENLDQVGDYFKTIVLGRLFAYYAAISDYKNAVKYAMASIEIGEASNHMLIPTTAYGMLARAAIASNNHAQAVCFTEHYLQLCCQNGVYDFFRMKKSYTPILEFAYDNGLEPEFTKEMMAFAGYKTKQVYIQTMGVFTVFPYNNRNKSIKMHSKKCRELLAYLLNAGQEGVTKEQIYHDLWSETESNNVKKLIGVHLSYVKKDLTDLGIENPIINHNKRYSICKDEIVCDIDLFEEAYEEYKLKNRHETALKLLSLYKGEYLCDFEALWAVSNRLRYSEAYKIAMDFTKKSF